MLLYDAGSERVQVLLDAADTARTVTSTRFVQATTGKTHRVLQQWTPLDSALAEQIGVAQEELDGWMRLAGAVRKHEARKTRVATKHHAAHL